MLTTKKSNRLKRLQDLEAKVNALQRAGLKGPPLWQPFANSPQEKAYYSKADELFFGGAAGGGKTDLLLGLAVTSHRRSIIYRREAVQAASIVDRSKEILGTHWGFNGGSYTWTSPDGRLMRFAGVKEEASWAKHQGQPFDFVGWDELAHFTRLQFRLLNGWNRTSVVGQRCRVVAAGNPPTTPEGRWVVEEFAPWLDPSSPNPAEPGELRWYAVLDGKLTWLEDGKEFDYTEKNGTTLHVIPRSRTFIPAKVTDNPVYVKTGYIATLQGLPEPMRSQFLYGDFTIREEDSAWQVIPTDWVRKAQARWKPEKPAGAKQTHIGVDVSRGGQDQTIIARRYGTWFAPLLKHPGIEVPDGPTAATLVIKAHEDQAEVRVDVIGVGGSCYDVLKEQSWFKTVGVNNSEAKIIHHLRDRSRRLKFVNVRAASYWKLREALDPVNGENLALPPDPELVADLTAPRFKVGVGGIQVESKDDIKKRLGRSPDAADSVVLAFFSPNFTPQTPRVVPLSYKAVLGPGRDKARGGRVILAISAEEAAALGPIEEHGLLAVNIHSAPNDTTHLDGITSPILGRAHFCIRDIDPQDYASRWGQPQADFGGLTPEEALVGKEVAKAFANEVLKQRDRRWEALLIVSDTDNRRAVAAAIAAADLVRLPHSFIVFEGRPEGIERLDSPCPHTTRVLKGGAHA
jgi:hypothetical protein